MALCTVTGYCRARWGYNKMSHSIIARLSVQHQMFPCMRARLVRLRVEVCDITVCQCSYKSSAAAVPSPAPLAETKAETPNRLDVQSLKDVYLPNRNI